MAEDTIKVELDTIEAIALLSIVHPTLAAIMDKEGLDKIIKAVKERDIKVLENLSELGKRAFLASVAAAKLEMELKLRMNKESIHAETTARA